MANSLGRHVLGSSMPIRERFHRMLLDGHFRFKDRRPWFKSGEQMQEALDAYLPRHLQHRASPGRGMNGRTFLGCIPAKGNPQDDNQHIDQAEAAPGAVGLDDIELRFQVARSNQRNLAGTTQHLSERFMTA